MGVTMWVNRGHDGPKQYTLCPDAFPPPTPALALTPGLHISPDGVNAQADPRPAGRAIGRCFRLPLPPFSSRLADLFPQPVELLVMVQPQQGAGCDGQDQHSEVFKELE